MQTIFNDLISFYQSIPMAKLGRAALVLIVGLILIRITTRVVHKLMRKNQFHSRTSSFTEKLTRYVLFTILISLVLHELGVSASVLIGTAGFLTVALGFASQTSVSNIISGLFLIGEKTFKEGDVIDVDGVHGYVLSIDLLSVKVRTFDNLLVRLPNEMLIKTKVINETCFAIRRADLQIKVDMAANLDEVRDTLMQVGKLNAICLEEPKPFFIVKGFGDGFVDIQFSAWAKKENYLELKNSIHREILQAFETKGIKMGVPQFRVQNATS